MKWYSILSLVFQLGVWTFVVFCVTWCFFSAYNYWLRCCLRHRRQPETANGSGTGDSSPETGLHPSEIEWFPKFKYQQGEEGNVDGVEIDREITECVVCLCAFGVGETLRLIPMCGHVFHAECVDVWLRSHATCPCCRAYLKLPLTSPTSTSELPV